MLIAIGTELCWLQNLSCCKIEGDRFVQVAEVLKSPKNKYMIHVLLEDGKCLTLPQYFIRKNPVEPGMDFPPEEIAHIKTEIIYPWVKNKALDYLEKRVYGTAELKDKLLAFGFLEEDILPILDSLREMRLLDDANFARCYVHDALLLKKQSKRRIFYDLRQKGVRQEDIDAAFLEFPRQEEENLTALLEKKLRAAKEDNFQTRQKIMAQLCRKGYSLEAVKRALAALDKKE
jgi:regulatory protein